MAVLLLLLAAEMAAISIQQRAQRILVEKWKEGSLTSDELSYLKRANWFRRYVWRPTSHKVAVDKKMN